MKTHYSVLGPVTTTPAISNLHQRCEQAIWGTTVTNTAGTTVTNTAGTPVKGVAVAPQTGSLVAQPTNAPAPVRARSGYVDAGAGLLFGGLLCALWFWKGKQWFAKLMTPTDIKPITVDSLIPNPPRPALTASVQTVGAVQLSPVPLLIPAKVPGIVSEVLVPNPAHPDNCPKPPPSPLQ